jgi:hypothetical protein
MPNYATISRAALRAEKEAFEALMAANADAKAFYDTYLYPLWKMDPSLIPETWI